MLDLCRFLSWFRQDDFFTGGSLIWDFEEDGWMFEVQNALRMDLFLTNTNFLLHKTFIYGLEWCGLIVNYCGFYQLFGLSFWRHPFTAEDPLVNRWCNATFLQIWWRNKLIYILDGLRVITFSANLNFWVNYSKMLLKMLPTWASHNRQSQNSCFSSVLDWHVSGRSFAAVWTHSTLWDFTLLLMSIFNHLWM